MSADLHPLAAEVSAQLNGRTGPFMMFVTCLAKPDAVADFIAAFMVPLAETVKESGNRTYRLAQDVQEPEKFVVIEHWDDLSALDEHLKQPYLEKLLADLEPLLVSEPTVRVMIEHFLQ